MARVRNIKRIVVEDFDDEYQELVQQLAFSLNPLTEQIVDAFNKNIDFENLNQEVLYFDTEVDVNGVPKTKLQVRTTLKTRIKGMQVISVENQTDTTLLSGAPFVNYTLVTGGFEVKQVTGLVQDKKYRLTVVVIG